MIKRIVILQSNGIRKIIGQTEVPADAVFEPTFTSKDHGTIEFVESKPHYLLYKEVSA